MLTIDQTLDHLTKNYPLPLPLKFQTFHKKNVPNTPFKVCRGLTTASSSHYDIKVALGTRNNPRIPSEILRTTIHEYKHCLQHSEDKPFDCQEANEFAVEIIMRLRGRSEEDISRIIGRPCPR